MFYLSILIPCLLDKVCLNVCFLSLYLRGFHYILVEYDSLTKVIYLIRFLKSNNSTKIFPSGLFKNLKQSFLQIINLTRVILN